MRAILLIAGAALALGGCGNNDQSDNTQNIDENLSAENIVSNDVTAIDAVTGDAANMAADVDMNFGNLTDSNAAASMDSNGVTPATKPKPKAPREGTLSPAPEPSTTTANSQ
ncbi:hypothetical protein [Sphingomonas sp.]|uniref:hypothetical protein n=1 Tax=Sphingomonas sp. TaxID=28214 RepID=UPI0038AFD36C